MASPSALAPANDLPGEDASPLLTALLRVPQGVLDILPIGFYACDAEGRILRVNARALELWGRGPGPLEPGLRFCGSFYLETLDGAPILPHQTPMARALLQGESASGIEARIVNPDGKRWIGKVVVEPLRDDDGRVVGAINCFRDVTPEHEMRKAAEETQSLLIHELNHRVKNVLAAVQSLIAQTLRAAPDLATAKTALDARIIAMAKAHDLLTARDWSGANVFDIVESALRPFNLGQVQFSGEALEVSSKHALALSLALHELATNAAKYGALSAPGGRVCVDWRTEGGKLVLVWAEEGGPAVAAPTRQGFGSRLIRTLLRDIDGEVEHSFPESGVRCRLTAGLPAAV